MERWKQKKRIKKEKRDHLFIEVKGEESAIAKANKSAKNGMSTWAHKEARMIRTWNKVMKTED